jgi:NAD(P)-dependent dehydrogenase (short-subunit alcohol dehydrogenase family)
MAILAKEESSLEIIKCGRSDDADIKVDFESLDQTRRFCEKLVVSPPDYLFVNHGVLTGKKLYESQSDDINKSVRVNLLSVIMILESLVNIQKMRTVIMSSISGKVGSYDTLYAACKAGVDVTIKNCASVLPVNSRLNAVSPGIIEDARMTTVRKDLGILEAKKQKTPTKKFTTSLEVATLIYYILFRSENLLGENINLNGGIYVP